MLEKDLEIRDTNKQWRKLVDYYNEWWEEKFGEKGHFKYTMRFDEVHLVSKKMGFIEWLVREEKIDFIKLIQKQGNWEIDNIKLNPIKELEYYKLLMLLAISENPISDLISYLK